MSGGNIFQEQVVELRALLRRRMALSRLKNTVRSEEDVTHEKELHEELVEGFKLGEIVGNNGHLKYSGVTKGVRPQPVQQQPVNHRDQLSNLLNLLGGLRLVPGPAAQGNLPMVHSHASVHQAIPANPSVQGRAQNMNNKPGIGAVRGRGAANGVPFAHRGAHNGVPAFAHGGASNG
ncbi:5'-3' exoribonuclease 1 [Cryptococcus neoformans A5-35-17]|nr:5'-3' exoribonuclease 1 [Cryptococcus neoformans var. grubii A5-35-17]